MADLPVGAGVALVAALLCGAAFFAASEIAFLAADRVRVREEAESGNATARLLLTFFSRPAQVLSTILISITTLLYFSEHLATLISVRLWADWGPIIAFVGVGFVVMVFAEVTPVLFASRSPGTVLRLVAWPLKLATLVLAVVACPVTRISTLLVNLAGVQRGGTPTVTEGDIRTSITVAQEQGVFAESRHRMLHGVLEMTDRQVSEVMVPRTDMVCVEVTDPIQTALDLMVDEHHSRLPVYEGDIDRIVGVLYAKDLIPALRAGDRTPPVGPLAREAIFIPETKNVSDLMRDFQASKRLMAMVVDEFGGIAGLVTMEDLLEEIVGEIYDETDEVQAQVEALSDSELVCHGAVPIYTVNRLMHSEIPDEGYDSVGGLVHHLAGRLPFQGDVFHTDDMAITVEEVQGKRITRVRIVKTPAAEGADADEL